MASSDPRDPQYGAPFVPVADVQTLTISGVPTGGTYQLTYNGTSTSNLAYNASASTIQAALRTLTGDSGLVVGGTGPFTITAGSTGSRSAITATSVSLTGGTAPAAAVTRTTAGLPSLASTSRAGSRTVLDMNALKSVRITAADNDNHYTPNGNMYHE